MLLDRYTLEKMYMSFIRPILEYADVIWDTQNQTLINKLEYIQIEAARIVTGGTKLTSHCKLYEETGWDTLDTRRKNHKLTLFHKIINNKTPQFSRDIVPNSVGSHAHNTRQTNNILNINTRTNLYAEYFLPSVIKVWNNIPPDTRDCQSLNIFKRRISNECISPPKYYYIGSRLGQVFHTRLRLNCSSLNSHLFVRNLVCSPNCTCGKIETTAHFLLECPKYSVLRQELFSCIDNYNLNI